VTGADQLDLFTDRYVGRTRFVDVAQAPAETHRLARDGEDTSAAAVASLAASGALGAQRQAVLDAVRRERAALADLGGAMSGRVERGDGWELRLGDWQDVLADVEADAVIGDAPYSARTHGGHDETEALEGRRALGYVALTEGMASMWGYRWVGMSRGWVVSLTDHVLARQWSRGFDTAGRYVFAPLPCIERGGRFRMGGDGPACVTVQLVAARPRSTPDGRFPHWGSLPGYYICTREKKAVVGGKPIAMMRDIVRDYSRPGDLVCDPCAGGGTTLVAAIETGRRAVGAERDEATFTAAVERLRRTRYQPTLPGLTLERAQGEQMTLGDE